MDSEKSAIILLGHGSRLEGANTALQGVAAQVAALLDTERVEVAFLQLAEPDLEQAAARCVAAGARQIAVVPFFLFSGAHVQEDIPAVVAALEARYEGVSFRVSSVLGGHPKLAEVAAARAREVMA